LKVVRRAGNEAAHEGLNVDAAANQGVVAVLGQHPFSCVHIGLLLHAACPPPTHLAAHWTTPALAHLTAHAPTTAARGGQGAAVCAYRPGPVVASRRAPHATAHHATALLLELLELEQPPAAELASLLHAASHGAAATLLHATGGLQLCAVSTGGARAIGAGTLAAASHGATLLHAASTHATALLHAATSAAHAAAALHAALHAAASHWATAPNASTLRQRAADEESRSQGVDDSHSLSSCCYSLGCRVEESLLA